MPINRTSTPVALSARLSRLAVEAQWVADQLVARPMDYGEAGVLLSGPGLLLEMVLDCVQDAMYRAEKLDQRRADEEPAVLRAIAEAHTS